MVKGLRFFVPVQYWIKSIMSANRTRSRHKSLFRTGLRIKTDLNCKASAGTTKKTGLAENIVGQTGLLKEAGPPKGPTLRLCLC
jgi:hypothetical protein